MYGLPAGQDRAKKDAYADRTVELLRKAIEGGETNYGHMALDPDLEALRERDDFKRLINNLKQKYPPEVAPPPRELK